MTKLSPDPLAADNDDTAWQGYEANAAKNKKDRLAAASELATRAYTDAVIAARKVYEESTAPARKAFMDAARAVADLP